MLAPPLTTVHYYISAYVISCANINRLLDRPSSRVVMGTWYGSSWNLGAVPVQCMHTHQLIAKYTWR